MTDTFVQLEVELAARPDPDVTALLESVFDAYRAETSSALSAMVDFDPDLWRRLEGLGLTRLTGSSSRGGGDASWVEAAELLGLAAAAAAPVPLAEHDVLGGWLLEVAGLPEGPGPRTVAKTDAEGRARRVPWSRHATSVVTLHPIGNGSWHVADVPAERLVVRERRNLAGESSDDIEVALADLNGVEISAEVAHEYHHRLTLARCAQIAGAMDRVLAVVLQHVEQRHQFGRQIGKFQAVQTLVTDLAAEAALAQAATDAAVDRVVTHGWGDRHVPFAIAVAASTVGHASSVVVRNAHQAVGAIGATLEHELPRLTKPILAHRGDVRSVRDWDAVMAGMARDVGPDGLWSLITRTSPATATAVVASEQY